MGKLGALLFGTGATGVAKGAKEITEAAEGIKTLFTGRLSPEKQADIETEFAGYMSEINKGQIEVNKEEAKSPSIFVAGWRPAIGWTGVFALNFHYIILPSIEWYMAITGQGAEFKPPKLDLSELIGIVIALLGVAGMRSYEKKFGVNRDH